MLFPLVSDDLKNNVSDNRIPNLQINACKSSFILSLISAFSIFLGKSDCHFNGWKAAPCRVGGDTGGRDGVIFCTRLKRQKVYGGSSNTGMSKSCKLTRKQIFQIAGFVERAGQPHDWRMISLVRSSIFSSGSSSSSIVLISFSAPFFPTS